MRFAYADPPYLGCALRLYGDDTYDSIDAHASLLARLQEFDGWAYSCNSGDLRWVLPLVPDARVGAWVKPFTPFRPGVGVAYAWEPIVFQIGRKRSRKVLTMRDWCSVSRKIGRSRSINAFPGAKPEEFCCWLFEVLGMQAGDEFHDLFPGSGAVSRAWESWKSQGRLFA